MRIVFYTFKMQRRSVARARFDEPTARTRVDSNGVRRSCGAVCFVYGEFVF